jgi:3-oxoacyl-[acyl-carrier protein] reductase
VSLHTLSVTTPQPPKQVAVNYASSPDKAEEVAAEITKLGGEAITIGCNVAKREELDALFKAVTDKWGQVDVLVNNAGE